MRPKAPRLFVVVLGLAASGLALAAAGCLDPLVEDTVSGGGQILPAGSTVPDADAETAARIAAADGVDGVIAPISSFADGNPTVYWDFGPTTDKVVPLYYLSDAAGAVLLPHPPIFDVVPGDAQYSPFWTVLLLPVTSAYQGEIIPSVQAIEEAQRRGLVGAPIVTKTVANCPVVASEVTLDPGDGSPPIAPKPGFVRGQKVVLFDMTALLGGTPMPVEGDLTRVPVGKVYRLRREGGEVLAEPVRGVDMTGDGDLLDSNDILASPGPAIQLFEEVSVAVKSSFAGNLVDRSGSDQTSAIDDDDDLLTAASQADPAVVAAFEATGVLRNLPFAPRPGVAP